MIDKDGGVDTNTFDVKVLGSPSDSGGSGGSGGPSDISGQVWEDTNNNAILNNGEVGYSRTRVNLLDATGMLITSTTTDGSDYYDFSGLDAGDYIIEFATLSGYIFSPTDQGSDDTLDSDANQTTLLTPGTDDFLDNIDAGLFGSGSSDF